MPGGMHCSFLYICTWTSVVTFCDESHERVNMVFQGQ